MTLAVLDRAQEDILQAERALRRMAEEENRLLRSVLAEVAYRLGGAILEETRRGDPGAPRHWGAAQWRAFFARCLQDRVGWIQPEILRGKYLEAQAALAQADANRQELARQLALAQEEIDRLKSPGSGPNGHKHVDEGPADPPLSVPALSVCPPAESWRSSRAAPTWPTIPNRAPARFASRLSGSTARWQREAAALYVMATTGWSVRLEILSALASPLKISPKAGSLKRLFENGLVANGLAIGQVLTMVLSQPSKLAVLRLSDEGRELCRALGWESVESEWERLIRLHQGELQEAHTAAVLAFAYHARQRGWSVQVMPEMNGAAACPDVLVEKDGDRLYVEVELGEDKTAKWRNLADLQGFVALCASTPGRRARLVSECRLAGLKGWATDVETLIQESGAVPGALWAELW